MALVKMDEQGAITLPPEIREALDVRAGDDLDVEVVDGGVLLKPAKAGERDKAWRQIREAMGTVRYVGPGPEPTEDEVMEEAVRLVKEVGKEMAKDRGARRR